MRDREKRERGGKGGRDGQRGEIGKGEGESNSERLRGSNERERREWKGERN